MPGYTYVAVNEKGKEKRGRMDAENRDAVSQQLKKAGLFPVEIKEQGALNKDIDFSIGKKVRPRDLSVFCRQFVSITQAGVPMNEALQMMTEQTENKWLKKAIADVLVLSKKVIHWQIPWQRFRISSRRCWSIWWRQVNPPVVWKCHLTEWQRILRRKRS